MPHAYTEDQLVEQPAIGLFAEQTKRTLTQPLPEGKEGGEGGGVTASGKGSRRIRSVLALIAGREPAAAEEQIHNLRWMGHTPEKLPCVNWKS
jgi:hypothetical protein